MPETLLHTHRRGRGDNAADSAGGGAGGEQRHCGVELQPLQLSVMVLLVLWSSSAAASVARMHAAA